MSETPQAVDWEVVAYHEAGHAVLATVLGFTTETLRLIDPHVPADKLATKADFHGSPPASPEEARRSMHDRAVYLYAARLAETRGCGRNCPAAWPADDLQIDWWYDILGSLGPVAPREQFEAATRERAEVLLAERWPAVIAVARTLLSEREIDGERLVHIVHECSAAS